MKRRERDDEDQEDGVVVLEHQRSEECPNNFPKLGPHQDAGHEIPASFIVGDEPAIVGRVTHEKHKTLRLPFSVISKRHCEISPAGILVDRSSNGTFVNGTRLSKGKPVVLRSGDRVSFYKPPERGTPPIDYVFVIHPKRRQRHKTLDETSSEVGARGYERREAEALRELEELRQQKKGKDDAIEALSRECERLSSTNQLLDRLFAHGSALSAKIVGDCAEDASRVLRSARIAEATLRDETATHLVECQRLRAELDDVKRTNATVEKRLRAQTDLNDRLKRPCGQAKRLVDSLAERCRHVQREIDDMCVAHQQDSDDDDEEEDAHRADSQPSPAPRRNSISFADQQESNAAPSFLDTSHDRNGEVHTSFDDDTQRQFDDEPLPADHQRG